MAKYATTPPDKDTIGGRLRWARERRGYTSARSVAEAFGWNPNTYKSHEQGIRRADSLPTDVARKYARAYGVSVAWLLTGTGDPLKPDLSTEQLELAQRLLDAMNAKPARAKAKAP